MLSQPPFTIYAPHWDVSTIGEVARRAGGDVQTGPFGSQLHAADYVERGIPSVMPVNIGDNRIISDGIARIRESDAARLSKYRLRLGDIIYSRRGDVERRALVREHQEGWLCGTGCLRIRFGTGIVDPAYASFYLGHPAVRAWIVQHAIGATMPNLNTGILASLPFVLPTLQEQQVIARVLGRLDDKIDLIHRTNETLESISQAIFRDWFIDFGPLRRKQAGSTNPIEIMGGIVQDPTHAAALASLFPHILNDDGLPEGWDVRPLVEMTSQLRRGIAPKYTARDGVLVLNQKCIRHHQVATGPAKLHDPQARPVTDRTLMRGDVLINSTGVGTLGRVAQIWQVDRPIVVDSHVTVVRALEGQTSPHYLGISLILREAEIESLGEGSTGQTELSRERLGRLPTLAPPLLLIEQFDALCSPLSNMVQSNRRQAVSLEQTRDYLLPRLMSGAVRVDQIAEIAT